MRVGLAAMLALYGIIIVVLPQRPRAKVTYLLMGLAFLTAGVTLFHTVIRSLSPWPAALLAVFMLALNHATAEYRTHARRRNRRRDD